MTGLETSPRAWKARHHLDSPSTKLCAPGTCERVLDEIKHWARDFDKPPIYWLNGGPKTGKSTIARTLVESMSGTELPWMSFFCSRKDQELSNPELILPALAIKLADQHPEFLSSWLLAIEETLDLDHPHPEIHMKKLILEPLQPSGIESTVIVIDALDECENKETVSQILSTLNTFMSKIRDVKLKFFITSRPEPHISKGFSKFEGDHTVFSLHVPGEVLTLEKCD